MELLKSLIFFLLKHHPIFWEPLEAIQKAASGRYIRNQRAGLQESGFGKSNFPFSFQFKIEKQKQFLEERCIFLGGDNLWDGGATLPSKSYKPYLNPKEALLKRRITSVQWLARFFAIDRQTDRRIDRQTNRRTDRHSLLCNIDSYTLKFIIYHQ